MVNMKKITAALLAGMMLVGCGNNAGTATTTEEPAATAEATAEATASTEKSADTPLVVGYSPFSSKFSPFFYTTAYDNDAQAMTQLYLLPSDRTGAVIYKGIDGETINYNGTDYTYYGPANLDVVENADGTVDYTFKLREDMKFSDGEPVTIDDVIFSMYVLCDPTYDGSSTLFAQPIVGMEEYRTGMDTLLNLLMAAGRDNTDFTNWTEDQQKAFWEKYDKATLGLAEEIVGYCVENGYNEEGDIAGAAGNWGFSVPEGGTMEDFAKALGDAYGADVAGMINTENAGSSVDDLFPGLDEYSTVGVKTGDSAPNIAGIKKVNDYEMTITTSKVDATTIYSLGVAIAPMHYYGDKAKYDYDNNMFGFDKGDLSTVRAKTTQPMGAGPYKFLKYENGVINYEANPNYFKGEPKTKFINFLETFKDDDKLNGVVTGTIDITDPSFSTDVVKAIQDANGGDIVGNVITTNTVDNLGYGYIGIAADIVNVGGQRDSDASKNLRKAFATIYSVYRDVAIDSYYGERADVINYPISNTSWAAPRPTDPDYKVAFSTKVDGSDIYTSGMSAQDKYDAAKAAALEYFEAAGYTVADGKLTAAPAGAALEYEVWIPADGSGDHPAFMILTEAEKALADLGMKLIIRDLSNSSDLWDGLEARTVPMWAAAWGASVDPDMYQIYYSDIANGGANPGGSNYQYGIQDAELDQMILDARSSIDQSYRKTVYKACLDTIVDWAVEVPTYQRQNAVIFSTERVDIDSVTPDITTFYGWMNEIENTVLK